MFRLSSNICVLGEIVIAENIIARFHSFLVTLNKQLITLFLGFIKHAFQNGNIRRNVCLAYDKIHRQLLLRRFGLSIVEYCFSNGLLMVSVMFRRFSSIVYVMLHSLRALGHVHTCVVCAVSEWSNYHNLQPITQSYKQLYY